MSVLESLDFELFEFCRDGVNLQICRVLISKPTMIDMLLTTNFPFDYATPLPPIILILALCLLKI